MHPSQSVVISFMPEEICNEDGARKQGCEMNAGKRFVEKVRQNHPQLGLILSGDSLFSRQPIIENIIAKRAHYLFVAKPTDHSYLMEWLAAYPTLNEIHFLDEKNREHHYQLMNKVPLSGRKDSTVLRLIIPNTKYGIRTPNSFIKMVGSLICQ